MAKKSKTVSKTQDQEALELAQDLKEQDELDKSDAEALEDDAAPTESPIDRANRLKGEYQAAMKEVRGIKRAENVSGANAKAEDLVKEIAGRLPGAILERSGRNLKSLTLRLEGYEDQDGNRRYQPTVRIRTVRAKTSDTIAAEQETAETPVV